MKIVVVCTFFPSHLGGLEIVATKLVRCFADSGLGVTWFASDTSPAPVMPESCQVVPMPSYNWFERTWGIPYPIWAPTKFRVLSQKIKEADLVHIHDCLYMPSILAFILGRIHQKPVIFTQHIDLVPYKSMIPRLLMRLASRWSSHLLTFAEATVFVGARTKEYFLNFRTFPRPPSLIPNGVDQNIFTPVSPDIRRAIRRRLGFDPERPLNIFVGRFVEKKGLHLLRAIIDGAPDAAWCFIGDGPIDPRQWKMPNVNCAGSLSQSDLVDYYRVADLLVLPSCGEGFPLVVQEAMACGTPCLISTETAQGLEQSPACIMTAPLTVPDFIKAVHGFYNKTDRQRHGIRREVAEYASKAWDWNVTAAAYLRIFANCLSKSENTIANEAA